MDVGVVLPIEEYLEDMGPLPRYAEIRELTLRAEALGFHSVWTGDHLIYRPSESTPWVKKTQGVWESWTILSALAEATERIKVGSWVLCTPLRNPAVLAKMASTLDEVS